MVRASQTLNLGEIQEINRRMIQVFGGCAVGWLNRQSLEFILEALAIRQDMARAEYEQAKAELARLRGELRGANFCVKAGAAPDRQAKRAEWRERLDELRALEKLLDSDVQRLGKEAKVFVGKTLDLIEFQREVEEKEELLRKIQMQASVLEVELNAPARVRRIQDAVIRKKGAR
jgi:hypothetical protein